MIGQNMAESSQPAFFFDRDGVVNVSPGAGYVLAWDAFHFSPGIIEALTYIKSLGYRLVLVTSQQGVGKKLMSQEDLDDIHRRMQSILEESQAQFDEIYSCTCLATDSSCGCRKPAAEMIYKAKEKLNLDLSRSWLIGDHDRDIQMASNAGVPMTIRILGEDHPEGVQASFTLHSTAELLPLLKEHLPPVNAKLSLHGIWEDTEDTQDSVQ